MDWFSRSAVFWRLFLVLFIDVTLIVYARASDCRSLIFPKKLDPGKALLNHVLDEINVKDEQMCRVMCYLNHDCVSYNIGPSSTPGMMACQLNDADRYQYPQDYQDTPAYSYRGSENKCADTPCTTANQTCQAGFSPQGYRCLCPEGFTGVNCEIDIDECSSNINNCSPNAECINKPGSFQCKCLTGFLGDGVSCIDIDECSSASLNNCSSLATCTNTPGSHKCTCKPGFTGDGINCNDIDECSSTSLNNCSSYAACTNTPGSHKCTCKPGFIGDGINCNGNGLSCNVPAKTCSSLKTAFPATASGVYCLDPDSDSTNSNSFMAYCDMVTEGGGWTLVWAYTFLKYSQFNSFANAVTPGPKNLGRAILSETAPQSETDYNAIDFSLWSSIGSEFMVKSNINNWVACVPGTGSLVTKTRGYLSCRMVKVINNMCTIVPYKLGYTNYGIFIGAGPLYYYFDTDPVKHWPTHDPCAQNAQNHLKNIPNPHGNIYVR